jgi:hypothetical protein
VDLKKEYKMNCVFHNKFKKWVPVSVVDSKSRCVNMNELLFSTSNQALTKPYQGNNKPYQGNNKPYSSNKPYQGNNKSYQGNNKPYQGNNKSYK